ESAVIVTEDNAELLLQTVVDSSANVLNVNSDQVKDNMTLIKEPTALSASTEVTGLTEEQIIMMANHAMVSSARSVDEALDFDTEAYFWLSFGLLLLILPYGFSLSYWWRLAICFLFHHDESTTD